jgi:two-component system, LuxR family, response regulator FixJ
MPAPADHCLYVIDDDSSVRKALQRLFGLHNLNAEVFASAEEFLEREIPSNRVGCLLVDIRMPGMSGLELQRALFEKRLILPIIFITGYGTVPMSVQAMKYGAFDFIEKPFDTDVLLDCIYRALTFCRKVVNESMEKYDLARKIGNLTSREREVLEGIARGQLNKEIAADLGVVEKTVKVHRASLKAKMEAGSLAELVRLYHRYLDLIDGNEAPPHHPYQHL